DGVLSAEPTDPTIVPPFDHLPVGAGRLEISWIPILGFGSTFANAVYEALVESYDLGGRVYPIVGFPAYQPVLYERVLTESVRGILDSLHTSPSGVRDQFLYANASDPFETRDCIARIVRRSRAGISWIGSPMGPKPMAL